MIARPLTWTWRCQVLDVIDGDTIKVEADLGVGVFLRSVPNVYTGHVRFDGYDAPDKEPLRTQARDWLAAFLNFGHATPSYVWVASHALEKFGRILGAVHLDDESQTDVLAVGAAVGWLRPYTGRGPRPWS